MSKSVFSIIIVLVSFLAVNFTNAQEQPKYIQNPTYENGKMISKTVYQFNDYRGGYEPNLLYEYTYSEDGKITSCRTSSWKASSRSWENQSIEKYTYNNLLSTITFTYSEWNRKEKAYDPPKETIIHDALTDDMNISAL